MCKKFVEEMHNEFEISMISELSFFLGLQIVQSNDGIFISQAKYVKEMLKKFGMEYCKLVSTPMVIVCHLNKDDESPQANQNLYRSMIRGLLYLNRSRLDIMQDVCLVARFQADPRETHVKDIKRFFRYLKNTLDY